MKNRHKIISAALLLGAAALSAATNGGVAQASPETVPACLHKPLHSDTLTIESNAPVYDSLISEWYNQNQFLVQETLFNLVDADIEQEAVDQIPDSVYIRRLKSINSAIPLTYNDIVKKHIVAYTSSRSKTMAQVMGRSLYYFPLFEAELDAMQLPLELRMLPVIESSLIPKARSRSGATGLWQFMYGTGKLYGLEVSSFVDQRCDPIESTKAACRYLKTLYGIFGDWYLVLAAYNCGPGAVNKAIKRAGGNHDYWAIYHYLPTGTRNYVPAFIAATYAYAFHKQYNIKPAEAPVPLTTDTLQIDRMMHLQQISSTIETPIEVLRALNPQYRLDVIPGGRERSYSLVLPETEVAKFLDNREAIIAKDTAYVANYVNTAKPADAAKSSGVITHKVKKGENLSTIARKYKVTVKQLMKWNRITNPSVLKIGQTLEIY